MSSPPPGTLLLLAAAAAGVVMWVWAFRRRLSGGTVFRDGDGQTVPAWAGFAGAAGYFLPALLVPAAADAGPTAALVRSLVAAAAGAAGAGLVWRAVRTEEGKRRPVREGVRDGGLAFLLALPVCLGLMAATREFRTVDAGNPLLKALLGDPSPAAWALIVASAVLVAPLGEELLFRGLILGSLRTARLPDAAAVAASAGLFAVVHPLQDWPPLFALACVLGWARVRTGSLLPCVVAHALFNAAFLAQVALDGPAAFR